MPARKPLSKKKPPAKDALVASVSSSAKNVTKTGAKAAKVLETEAKILQVGVMKRGAKVASKLGKELEAKARKAEAGAKSGPVKKKAPAKKKVAAKVTTRLKTGAAKTAAKRK